MAAQSVPSRPTNSRRLNWCVSALPLVIAAFTNTSPNPRSNAARDVTEIGAHDELLEAVPDPPCGYEDGDTRHAQKRVSQPAYSVPNLAQPEVIAARHLPDEEAGSCCEASRLDRSIVA